MQYFKNDLYLSDTVGTDKDGNDSIVITKAVIVSNAPREKILKALGTLAENREVEIINE